MSRSLQQLLAPADVDAFFQSAWTRDHFVVRREDPAFYHSLFPPEELDALIAMSRWEADEVTLQRVGAAPFSWTDERSGAREGAADVNRIYLACASGYTLRLGNIDARWPPLGRLCAELEAVLHHPAHVAIERVPAGTVDMDQTTAAETFLLQLGGSQRRQLDDDVEITLRSGDLLYLPKRTRAPLSTDASSLHLVLTVETVTFLDLAHAALDVLAEDEPRLRQALPGGFLDRLDGLSGTLKSLLYDMAVQVRAADAAPALRQPLLSRAVPPEGGRFAHIDAARALVAESVVERRAEVFCALVDGQLSFAGVAVDGPLRALEFVLATPRFTVSEVPMEEPLELVRRLVEEGLLGVAT